MIVGVQAKHYYNPDPPVGASVVQQLIRGIEGGGEDVTHGMVITSGTISPEATAEAEKYTEGTGVPINLLITYEAQLPAAGGRWQGFRRLRDDLSGRIDRRFALSNDPPTAIDHHVRPQAELRT